MKLWGIFRFEFAYQVRRPWTWLFLVVLLVVAFLMSRDAAIAELTYEDYFRNSPFSIAIATVIGGVLWLVLAAVVAGEAAARDVATGMHPLVWTSSVSRTEYLGGRFLAALALNAVLLLAVQAGILLGSYSPGVNPEVLGPFRPEAYLTAYAYLALPNAFVATALQFTLASRAGRPMASYLGSMFLVFMGFFVASLLLFRRGLGTLLDPIGIRFVVEDVAHLWTTVEKSHRLLSLDATVGANRLVWMLVGLATVAFTWTTFRFAHRAEGGRPWRRRRRDEIRAPEPGVGAITAAPITVPAVPRSFGFGIQARQALAVALASFRAMAGSWAGLATLVAIPLLSVAVVLDQMLSSGTPLTPQTARVLAELTGPLTVELSRWVVVPFLLVYFAGELVWRERESGVGEITDAMPGSEWAPLVGKFLGLGLLVVVFLMMLMLAGMLAQVIERHHDFDIGLYLAILFGFQLPEYLLFAVLALAVHVVVDQKYVGHVVAIMVYVFVAVLSTRLGVEHNLLIYGAGPWWRYTDMLGFGGTVGPWLWFKLYWAGWALLLAVGARLLWVRGREGGFAARIAMARERLTRATVATGAIAILLVIAAGGFVFYNTNVLNEYVPIAEAKERRAEYERRYRRYESAPQPRLAGTTLRIEIHPARRAVEIRGSYRLVNDGEGAIDSLHVATAASAAETRAVKFDRPATLALDDPEHGHRTYVLARPLAPGDSMRLDFEVNVARRGFGNRGADRFLTSRGSSFSNASWFPMVGYQRSRELLAPSDRRDHGLEQRPILEHLYDEEGRALAARGGGIAFEATIGTDRDQMAVAPGALRRSWSEQGRRYYHYVTDAPIGSEWAFFSARFAVREERWNDVAIRMLHFPSHTGHLDRMMRSVKASLAYYGEQFGPYPYRHLTVVEHPGAPGTGMHAEPSMISHGEGVHAWHPRSETGRLDLPYAVMAHEMAHQWTLPYALVEGLPFLSEGLAWYSAMQVVKTSRGDDQLQRLLAFMRTPNPFAPIRRGEPLIRALDPYLSYRRGPYAMHLLSEYAGSDRVNGAIRRLVERSDLPGAPPVTTLDLYRELQAAVPDSLAPLLRDLFEVNTLWQFATERVRADSLPSGAWRVTLDVRARKFAYDTAGAETDVPMDEWVPVGVFAAAEEGQRELSAPLHLGLHRVRSGRQTITMVVSGRPALAGIDPHHLLDWEEREEDDNVTTVTTGETRR